MLDSSKTIWNVLNSCTFANGTLSLASIFLCLIVPFREKEMEKKYIKRSFLIVIFFFIYICHFCIIYEWWLSGLIGYEECRSTKRMKKNTWI